MSSAPLNWRSLKEKYQLIGTKCETCGKLYFPSRKICPTCRRLGRPKSVKFSGKGTVFSYSVVRNAPEGFELFTPYVIGLIQLDLFLLLFSGCIFFEVFLGHKDIQAIHIKRLLYLK